MSKWWEVKKVVHTIWQACKTPDGADYYFNTETNETTWDKPEELMTDEEKDASGDWVWVPDDTEAFVPGKVLSKAGGKTTVELEDCSRKQVPDKDLQVLKKSSLQVIVADLTLLDAMTPPLILHNLKKRFEQNKIYTNVGTILISCNPYQALPIYSRAVIEKYMMRGTNEMEPHVFNIAHDSFIGLTSFGNNQSIIISGESGAGKTEATKQCLNYISAIAGSVGGVEKKVLQANPILEGFGNAKTLRNNNSSRFGKYMELFFTKDNRIESSNTTNYLLEKIRVVQQAPGERNFHIFYMLTKCARARKELRLMDPEAYTYLAAGGCISVPGIDDAEEFRAMEEAWKELAFKPDEVTDIYKLSSAILSLGNITFGGGDNKATIPDKSWMDAAAELLSMDPATLFRALTIRVMKIKGAKDTDVAQKQKEAEDARHALAKFIYGNLFDWLVRKINQAMGVPRDKTKSIGLLDIFGFEIFEKNSFEQLCINYTNEMLQQHFNQHTFKLEEQLYKAEKIKFAGIAFVDNMPMIELITKKPTGILPMLDEELVVPKGTDKTFLAKMHEAQKANKAYKNVMKNPDHFIVRHYAGDVVYDGIGFLDKNRDRLTDDLLDCVQKSKNKLLNVLFPPEEIMSSADKKSSLSKQFQVQLNDLMTCLNKTEPHYIRCVKPNEKKAPLHFVPIMSYQQLTYSGVFEAVAIRKAGFPFRLKHDEFAKRYNCILGDNVTSTGKDQCMTIVKHLKLNEVNVQVGATMMLYRADEHKKLELDRSIKITTKETNAACDEIIKENTSSYDKAKKDDFIERLAAVVKKADSFRIKSASAEKARKMLDDFIEARMDPETKSLLQKAIRDVDKALIEKGLKICAEEGFRTSLTRQCSELLEQILEVEEACNAVIGSGDPELLRKCVEMADKIKYNQGVVAQVRKLLADIEQCRAILTQGKQILDHETLTQGVQFADQIPFSDAFVVECKALLKRIMDARTMLETGKNNVDQGTLEQGLAMCDNFGYTSDLVEECRHLCARVTRVNQETDKASQTLDEDHVRTCHKAGEELYMTSQWLEYFKTLCTGPYDAFLEAMCNKNLETNNPQQYVRNMIKRKDILIQEKGANFKFENYSLLKGGKKWADEKIFGKEKRMMGYLKWTRDAIHSPLTNIVNVTDKKKFTMLKKAVKSNFATLLIQMGIKKDKKLGFKLAETLKAGVDNPEIRNEFYLHAMKQTQSNPDPSTNAKVWEFIALMLLHFPPSEDFENYLESFLRANKADSDRFKCTGLLRKIVYEKATRNPASMSDCENPAGYIQQRTRGFTQPQPSNSYDDLRHPFQPYYGGGGGGGYGGGGGGRGGGGRGGGGFQQQAAGRGGGGFQQQAAGRGGGGGYQQQAAAVPAAAAPARPAAAAAPAKKSPWRQILDESSGDYYYYNDDTGQSTWDPPPGL